MGLSPEINRVVYAGQNRRRQAFLRHEFADITIDSYPGGEEPDIPNVIDVMHGKINYVLAQFLSQSTESVMVLAADTRTATVCLTDNGKRVGLISRGKPVDETSVQETFVSMARASKKTKMPPIYMVESASGSHLTALNVREHAKRYSVIELDPHAVAFFATDRGFSLYNNALKRFYVSSAYREENFPPTTVTDLSAGLSLPVLMRLGAVYSVDHIPVDDEHFIPAFKKAVFTAAIGFAPALWGEDIHVTINGWPWLDKVTGESLQRS